MKRLAVYLSVCAVSAVTAVAAHAADAKSVVVLPCASASIADNDALVLADAVRKQLIGASISVVDGFGLADAMQKEGCLDRDKRNTESCVKAMGAAFGGDFVLAGAVNRIGNLTDLNVALYDVSASQSVWSKEYKLIGAIEDFYEKVPAQLAQDLPRSLFGVAAAIVAPAAAVSVGVETSGAAASEPKTSPRTEQRTVEEAAVEAPAARPAMPEPDGDLGIVKGPTIGLSGLVTLGYERREQTPFGFAARFLYPTGRSSQLRLRCGVPLVHNHNAPYKPSAKKPDVFASLEHEWGSRYGSISVGLAYMYMWGVRVPVTISHENAYGQTVVSDRYTSVYDPGNSVNMVISFRGGKTRGGVVGRFSWPLPYIIEENSPKQYFVEYSLMGVFGGPTFKGGAGLMGMNKRRDAAYVLQGGRKYPFHSESADGQYEPSDPYGQTYDNRYDDFGYTELSEYYVLFPVLRMAALLAEHVVVGATFELGGTLFPRRIFIPLQKELGDWQPCIGLDVVYSFGKLGGANALDGSF